MIGSPALCVLTASSRAHGHAFAGKPVTVVVILAVRVHVTI